LNVLLFEKQRIKNSIESFTLYFGLNAKFLEDFEIFLENFLTKSNQNSGKIIF